MKKKVDKQLLKKPNILVFILLIILILTTLSFLFYKRTENSLRQDRINELEFFSRSKIEELLRWRSERIADANVITKSPFFTEGLMQWIENRDNEFLYKNIHDRLAPVKLEYRYRDIILTSPEGEILFNVDKEDSLMPDYISNHVLKLINEDSTVISDFYYCEFHDEIHYDIVSPLKLNDSTKIANLIFRIDPHKYIYPILSKWAEETETGEVLLYGIEQDSIVLLNEPRINERRPLKFKSSLSFFVDESTAESMLTKETIIDTKDFHGNDVLAFSSPVKNTSWILITKIDKAEIFSEMRFMTIVIILTAISIILILILITGYIFSLRQENIYKELYRAEHELRVSQEEFKTTLYSIGDGVITTDRYGNVKEMNSSAEQLTGWKEGEARGKVLKEVFPIISQETGEPIHNPVEIVISKGKIVGFSNHTLLISKDGKKIPITDGGAPIRNEKGEIIGVVLVFQDQTSEREAKISLMESERKLATLMTNLPGMVYRLKYDKKRTTEFISSGSIKLTGYEPIEFFNDDLLYNTKIIHPFDVERVFSEINEALLLGSGYESEYRIITKSGEERWVLEKGQAIYSEDGEIEHLEGIVTDITDKKIALQKLADSKELLNRTGSIGKIGGWEYDVIHEKLSWTDEAAIIYGDEPDGVYTIQDTLNCYTEDSREKSETAFNNLVKEGIPYDLELDLISAKGEHKWVHEIGHPVIVNGVIVKVRGTIQDITEKKIAIQKLADSEELLNRTGSIAKIGGWEYDVIHDVTTWTDETAIIYGLEPGIPITLEDGLKYYTENSRKIVEKSFNLLVKDGIPYDHELDIVDAKGVHKWVHDIGHPVIVNGVIVKVRGTVQDITEKKIVEEERERLNSILESTTDFVGIADVTGKPVFVNKAGRKMVGLGENEKLKQKSVSEFHPVWVQEILFKEAIPYANEHGIWRGETAILNKDGVEVPLSQIIISHKDIKGNTVYLSTIARDISDQKEYERKLESSDRIFNHSIDMLCIAGFDGYFKVLNPAWEKTLGYTREELMSKQWIDFIHPDDKAITIKMGEKLFSGEHVTAFENRYITKDGSIKYLSWSVYSYPDMKMIYGSAKDVTKRKQLESEIKESDSRLKLTLKNAPIVLFNQDKDLKYTWIHNPNHFSNEEVIGKTDFDLLPKEDAERLTDLKQNVLSTGESIREVVTTTINGKKFYYDLAIEAINDDNGNTIGINCASIDISERIQFEDELLKFSHAIEQISVSIIITDKNGNINYVNPYFTILTEYSFKEVKEKNPRILKSGIQGDEFYKNLWETISNGQEWRGELCNRKKNGELYWENALISPVINKSGEIAYFIAIKEDITEKKKILDDLIIAKYKAEESDKLKTAFLHNISHEVRTPLHGITGFINLLSEPDITDEEYDEYIEIINHSSERLISIISNLISISTLETGQETVQETETDLDEIINDLYRQLKVKIKDQVYFTLKSDLEKEFPKILVDKTKVFQVLSNLLENAIKFTEKGYIKLEYGLTDDNMKMLFSVEDSGIGIPEKFQDVIFDRFRQVETTLNNNYGGNGLGLSISKAYVEMMGGEMWLESEVGKGSKFYFTIPNKKVESK